MEKVLANLAKVMWQFVAVTLKIVRAKVGKAIVKMVMALVTLVMAKKGHNAGLDAAQHHDHTDAHAHEQQQQPSRRPSGSPEPISSLPPPTSSPPSAEPPHAHRRERLNDSPPTQDL
ncbi:uncharacterized protein LOC134762669 [Penaeus indicus]|uniref:uncharacterized protein LOC134762669 n=1 Tax=Penaeus indicus TaxID=29960 RepID=UPI00300C3E33